ncbi:MAG: non-homologous end-joining DNA ligase [Chitinophagaceae bacterium]|nr:non-homologous end-joining DNA ligase [Chitinophagaceae bacterium]
MALTTYKQKRSFSNTPEPEGGKPSGKDLLFVIQKHDASHLHYDLRLEMQGVLKSWAIPKGPSMDPTVKRLAILVEDHPFDYRNFEGIIPKGQYGGGTVIVWDEGTYEIAGGEYISKKQMEEALLQGVHKGKIHFIMHGKKLKGEFALVKASGLEDNSWLLMKIKDKYAKVTDVLKKEHSVISGKTVGQMKKITGKIVVGKETRKTKAFLNLSENQQVKMISGKELTFTNLKKIYWPKEKISKGDMINYYHQVAPYILPFMKNRPQSLNRFPNGIKGESFYQKNIAGKFPDWLATHDYENKTIEGDKKFLVCEDEASLLYMANLGCIEMNPWNSRAADPDHPDWSVIDLDPDTNSFEEVIETAQVVKTVLDKAGIKGYPKTSGSTGIHIYIPLGGKYDYERSKMLARLIVTLVHRELPDNTSLERSPAKRKKKIYLDYLQNRHIQTIAAPFSLRPKPGATVSMPLEWSEVKKGLQVKDFTIYNAAGEAKERVKLWKPVLGKGIDLEKVVRKLGEWCTVNGQ